MYSSRNQFCTHAYILNRSAAEVILSVKTPVRFEIDAFKFYYCLADVELYKKLGSLSNVKVAHIKKALSASYLNS